MSMKTNVSQSSTALTRTPQNKPSDPFSHAALQKAAGGAYRKFANLHGKCHKTSEATAKLNGGAGDHASWKKDTSFRGKSLSALKDAIVQGTLKPGMVIYANKHPGTDPQSINLENGPHWFTYLGKDAKGSPRFGDQYSTDCSIEKMASFIKGRKIDAFFDPYKNRPEKAIAMEGDRLSLSK